MVKIRLARRGAKKHPSYRIVVADSRTPRNGKKIDDLGYYDPMKDPAIIKIDLELLKKWLSKGAQSTDAVKLLLKRIGFDN